MPVRLMKCLFTAALLTAYGLLFGPYIVNQLDEGLHYSAMGRFLSIGIHLTFWILIAFMIIKVVTRKRGDEVLDWRLDVLVVGLVFLALAAPGLLEDKQRSKLARVRVMMREAALTIEIYQDMAGKLPTSLDQLETYPTTSIGERALRDPYSPEKGRFSWIILDATSGAVVSTGPDGVLDWTNEREHIPYDPTNGVKSPGDLVRYVNR